MVPRPLLIGITGGIGAGKSTLLDAFVRRGASSFSADAAVRALYDEPAVSAAVRERWGTTDRAEIARIVFDDEDERRWLEALLHPLVAEAWRRFVDEQSALPDPPELIVAEVPLLFEARLEDRYDAVVAVTAPRDVRIARARARGDDAASAAARADAQLADEEKVARAHFAFENTGDLAALDAFAGEVVGAIRARDGRAGA